MFASVVLCAIRRAACLLVLAAASLAGCARLGGSAGEGWRGPAAPAVASIAPSSIGDLPARRVRTAHFTIHTTLEDEQVIRTVAQVLEGALEQYQRLVPGLSPSARPMEVFLFQHRREWAAFTQATAGADAPIYLSVVRGGYTRGDRSVAFFLGDLSTYSVVAHEGFHQFVSRHFAGRLPPFLEEGFACMFEAVVIADGLPRWNWSVNANRLARLREAAETGNLWPLDELIHAHAGEVVGQPVERVEAFYAQNWAFARFLWEAEAGAHRPALRRMLADIAAGRVAEDRTVASGEGTWRPEAVVPLLEHYLDMPLAEIDRRYQAYIRLLTADAS